MSFALLFAVGAALAEEPAPPATTTTTTETAPADTAAPADVAATPDAAVEQTEEQRCAGLADAALSDCRRTFAIEKAQHMLAQVPDCATKEGDDKTRCETTKADLERRLASLQDPASTEMGGKKPKRGKAKRSNSNRLEAEDSDE